MTLKPNTTTISSQPTKIVREIPVKIGTKGTIGSLMMKELEYFNRLEVLVHSQKHSLQVPEAADTSGELYSVTKTQKTKKKVIKFVPRFCSVIDVADTKISYKTLKADIGTLQV